MARIRTIKPEFPQSESMGRVSREARLLFVMLWTICDDHGRTRAHSRMLASLLFPYDDDAGKLLPKWLAELEKQGCIELYEVGGSAYLQIPKWGEHQKIDRPSKPQFPSIEESTREASRDSIEPSSLEGKGREGKGGEGTRGLPPREPPRPVDDPMFPEVPPQVVADFRKLRAGKKAPVTETAIAGIKREAEKAGMSLADALAMCCERGWTGFKADWDGVAQRTKRSEPAVLPRLEA